MERILLYDRFLSRSTLGCGLFHEEWKKEEGFSLIFGRKRTAVLGISNRQKSSNFIPPLTRFDLRSSFSRKTSACRVEYYQIELSRVGSPAPRRHPLSEQVHGVRDSGNRQAEVCPTNPQVHTEASICGDAVAEV